MTLDQFRAQQYQPGQVLAIRTWRRRRGVAIRVLAVIDEGQAAGVLGIGRDGGFWAVDAEYILGTLISIQSTTQEAA